MSGGIDLSDVELTPGGPGAVRPDRIVDARLEEVLRAAAGARRAKWIWVLSGGGAKGDFEAGAALYLSTRLEFYRPQAVCGTSVGAVNAVAIAEASPAGFRKLRDAWLSLVTESDMYVDADWIAEVRRLETFRDLDLRALVASDGGPIDLIDSWDRTGMLLGSLLLPGIFGFLAAEGVEDVERDLRALSEILRRARSVFSLAPTRARLERNLDLAAIDAAGTLLRLVCISLESGYRCAVTEAGDLITLPPRGPRRRGAMPGARRARVVQGVMASAAIPGLFPPVRLTSRAGGTTGAWEEQTYVDGGVRDVLPLDSAFDIITHSWTAPEPPAIIAISASQAGELEPPLRVVTRTPPSYADANFTTIAARGVETAVDELHATELDRARWPSGTLIAYVTPTFTVHDTTVVDPGLIQIAMAYGYMRAFDRLDPAAAPPSDATAYALSDVITEARLEAWRLENRARTGIGPRTYWDESEIKRVRALKRKVRQDVRRRIARFGAASVPAELSNPTVRNTNRLADWWQQWERHKPGTGPDMHFHSTDPFTRWSTPWESQLLIDGATLPEETPPAPL